MSLFRRRDFLKSVVALLAANVRLQPLAEALEIKRRGDMRDGVAKPGAPDALPAPEDEAGALRFLLLGDWGWAGVQLSPKESPADKKKYFEDGANELAVAKAMGLFAATWKPDFVFSLGDNFYPDGVKSEDDPRWRTAFEEVFTAPGLDIPWHVSIGNHDYRGSIPAQIAYSAKSKRWKLPARRYSLLKTAPDGATVRFVVIDTCPFAGNLRQGGYSDVVAQDAAAQLEWLEAELSASKADHTIVVGHHPIWTGGVRRDMAETTLPQVLPPILKRHGVKLYLCGHEHDAQHIERDGITHIICGHGADIRPTGITPGTVYAESGLGFGYAVVTRKEIRIRFIDVKGAVRHTAVV